LLHRRWPGGGSLAQDAPEFEVKEWLFHFDGIEVAMDRTIYLFI